MALFDVFKKKEERKRFSKKAKVKEEKTELADTKKKEEVGALAKASNFAIGKPHITEKATGLQKKGIYVFKVAGNANSVMVKAAIKKEFGVKPIKVNILNMPVKTVYNRGRMGEKAGFKKAVVFLKKGDEIKI